MQMYTRSSVCMLLFLVRTYSGGPPDVPSINHIANIRGTTEHMLLFEMPLANTWMYKAAFGLLGKNHRTYARVGQTSAAFQGVGGGPLL